MVATKFAYASPLENERMVHSVEPVIDSRNRQILSGWLRPSRDLRNVQLLFASVRQECDLTLATFELQSASETALFGSENELCKANRSNGSNNGQGNNYTEEASPLDESPNATGYHHQEHQSRHHQSSLPSGGFGSLNIDNSSIISKPSEVPRAVLEMKANLNETYGEYMGGMGSPTVTLSRPPRNNELQPLQVNSDGEFLPSDEPSSLPPLHQQQQKHESTGTTTPPSQNQGRMSTVHQFQLANKVEDRSMKRIPAWYAATEILDSACEQTSVASSGLLFGIVHAIIPYIANSIQRFVKGENNPVLLDDSLSTGIPLSIAVSLAGIFLMTTNFMFLMVGIQDFKRRLIAQQQRHAILRNGFLARPRELDAVIEKINIKENRSSKVMKKKKIQKKLEKFTFTTGGENQEEGGTAQEQESEEVDQDQQDNSQNNGINIDINDENNNENSGRDLDRIQQEAIDSVVNMQRQSTTRFYEKIRKGSTAATTTGNNNIIRSSVVVEEEASDENNNTNHHSKSHTVDFDKEAEVVEDGLGKNDNQKSNGFEPIIRIPMDRHQNILTWWYLRVVLQDYGLAYQKRIALFCGYFVLYMAALLVAIVIEVMLQTANIDLATVLYIGFHGLTISLLVITMVRYGSQYNHSRKEDVSILIRKQMDLEIQLAHIQQLKKRHPYIFRDPMSFRTNKTLLPTEAVKIEDPSIRIKQAIDALKTVQAAVIVDNGIHGIRILGFEAGHEVMS